MNDMIYFKDGTLIISGFEGLKDQPVLIKKKPLRIRPLCTCLLFGDDMDELLFYSLQEPSLRKIFEDLISARGANGIVFFRINLDYFEDTTQQENLNDLITESEKIREQHPERFIVL